MKRDLGAHPSMRKVVDMLERYVENHTGRQRAALCLKMPVSLDFKCGISCIRMPVNTDRSNNSTCSRYLRLRLWASSYVRIRLAFDASWAVLRALSEAEGQRC